MPEEQRIEKQSSIEVAENSKNQFTFKVKIYFDEENREFNSVTDEIDRIYADLHGRFKS